MSLVEVLKKTERKEVETLPLKVGSYVQIAKTFEYEGDVLKVFRVNNYVGRVTQYYSDHSYVNFFPAGVPGHNKAQNYAIVNKYLKVVSKEEAEEIIKTMEETEKKFVQEQKEKLKEKIGTKRLPIPDRNDYNIADKTFLNTNYNYLKLFGTVDRKKTEEGDEIVTPVGNGSHHVSATCCSLTKCTQHIVTYIPKDWLAYYGYNGVDLKSWLKFLGNCEIGFKGHLLEETTFKAAFGSNRVGNSNPVYGNNNFYINEDMEVYPVLIENTGHRMQNYMHFLLVRYIYNGQYWNIPAVAMQIKRAVLRKMRSWEVLLTAHMLQDYYSYYCLVSNHDNSLAIPNEINTPAAIVSKLQGGNDMNTSFSYTQFKNDEVVGLRAAIKSKDYNAIYKFIKNCRTLK